MKTTVIHGLLLVVVVYSQNSCRRDKHNIFFYIHNETLRYTNNETYFFSPNSDKYECYNKSTDAELINQCDQEASYIYCNLSPLQNFPYPQVCTLLKHSYLSSTKNWLASALVKCTFDKEICQRLWSLNICKNLSVAGSYGSSTTEHMNTNEIHKGNQVMKVEVKSDITVYGRYPNRTYEEDGLTSKKPFVQYTTKPPKTWYLYEYPTQVTVHMVTEKYSCQELSRGETEDKNNTNLFDRWKKHFCELSSCNYENATFCRKSLSINLAKNAIESLPSDCNYSEGVCKSLKAFWEPFDRCAAIRQVSKAYEARCSNTSCLFKTNKKAYLTTGRGRLCGEVVWYTNQNGIIAADKELQFVPTTTNPQNNSFLFYGYSYSKQNWGYDEYFVIVPFALFFFWFFIGIVICLIYPCLKKKRRLLTVPDSFEMDPMEEEDGYAKYEVIRGDD